ncbi:MAG: flagellin [Ilumatobacteraceae bacterium]
MRINTNVAALSAHRNLSKTGVGLNKSIERLSSGLRINRAGDDAAGLVISQKLRAESSGLKQSIRNAQDGISFVQTAEGALDEVGGMLNRMRDLVVQARNGTQDSDSIAAIQAEYDALATEITRIGSSTEFAGKTVFSATAVNFQVGNASTDQIGVTVGDVDVDGGMGLGTVTAGAFAGAAVNSTASTHGSGSQDLLSALDAAISSVSETRGELGATQNRLESTVRNLSVTAENLAAAESRIRDVDVAEEMMSFTRSQILQQAGTAMLAQANGVSQGALQLLG